MTDFGVRSNFIELAKSNLVQGFPVVADVAGSAPQISSDFRSPLPDITDPVLAEAVDHGPSRFAQSIAHLLIYGLHFVILVYARSAAPIVFEVVDPPRG